MKITLLILFLTIGYNSHARVGMGEISFATPGGHVICDCDPYANTPVLVGYESKIHSLDKWYFYRNYIVGQGNNYYFIFNELTNDLQYFTKKQVWEQQIVKKDLKPIYTRWCDISDSPDSLRFALVLSSFIITPIVLIVAFFIIGLTYVKVISWNKKTWTFVSVVVLIVGLFIAYRLNIHSI